jgi:protein AbiQ
MSGKRWLPIFFTDKDEGDSMFRFEESNMKFVHVDEDYLKALHEVCEEVRYKSSGYDNKLYVGVLIDNGDRKYVIPLTSAKTKHKEWKNVDRDMYLIYEYADKADMGNNDIWVEKEDNNTQVKHIMSVLDVKKMIPVKEGYYSTVQLNEQDGDSKETLKYKDLLNKEYSFCLKIKEDVVDKANKIYDRQMKTNKVMKFCCDFKSLERASDTYRK